MSHLIPLTKSNSSTTIKSMPGFVFPIGLLSLLLVSSPEPLLPYLAVATLFVPIRLLLYTIGAISIWANSTSPSSTPSQILTLMCRMMSRAVQSAERPFFPRSHAGWQKRIHSNDRKVIRFHDHSRELIFCPYVKQEARYMVYDAG